MHPSRAGQTLPVELWLEFMSRLMGQIMSPHHRILVLPQRKGRMQSVLEWLEQAREPNNIIS